MFKLISTIFLPFIVGLKYDCSLNETIGINLNEIVFFESPNYPSYIVIGCNLSFSMIEPNKTQKLLIAYNVPYEWNKKKYILSNETFSLQDLSMYDYLNGYIALQGFVTHEDISAGCPLEALCNPMIIHDETEIIHIRSTYYDNEKRIRPCTWQFKTTQKYGFKVVIEILNISASTLLTVRNSTNIFVIERMALTYQPYYNQDNYIQISLSIDNSTTTFIPEIEFQAYVSVVKKQYHKSDANCTSIDYDPFNSFSKNFTIGYQNNAQCSHSLIILPNHMVFIQIQRYYVEKGVDYVQYSIDGGNYTVIDVEEDYYFIVEVQKEEMSKFVFFEFISDGSVQAAGFEIGFNNFVCECANSIIPCKQGPWWIMQNFEPCYGYKIQIAVYLDEKNVSDTFIFSSNNETVLKINKDNFETEIFMIYLNPANVNTLEVITTYYSLSSKLRSLSLDFLLADNNTVLEEVLLTSNNSFLIIDNSKNDYFEISQNPTSNNMTYILYTCFENRFVQIYNNKSLTINYSHKNCFSYPNAYKCILPYQSFVVSFKTDNWNKQLYTFLAIRLSKPSKGCVLEENIFTAKKTDENLSVVGISNSEGKCALKLTIASDTYFYISHLWTTAVHENVKIYVGLDTSHLLLEFNAKTMKNWNYIGLFSSVYSIHIPQNSTFFMTLKKYNFQTLNIAQRPFHTMIATPNFNIYHGNRFPYIFNDRFISFIVGGSPIRFTILHYKMLMKNKFYINNENLNINYTAGTSLTFKNQIVHLYYVHETEEDSFDNDEGVIINVESVEN